MSMLPAPAWTTMESAGLNLLPPTPANLLLGGSLSTGPTGLGGISGAALNGTRLPYTPSVGGLLSGPAAPTLPRLGVTGGQNLLPGLRPLATSLAPMAPDTQLAAQAARAAGSGGARGMLGAAGRSLGLSRPGLLKGGAWSLAGGLGSNLIDATDIGGQNSNIEQALQGAALGGGAGAAFGPVGAAIGAAGGGALGLLANTFGFGGGGDDDAPDPVNILANAITTAGLSPDATEDILQTYDTLIALAEQQPDEATREAARQQAFDQTAALILQTMQQEQLANDTAAGMGGPDLLALQSQAAQIFQPLANDVRESANLYAQAMSGIRDNLPESYRAVADATVARELSSADKLANAYIAQAALTPVAQRLTQYQQDQAAFANQQWQQMLARQAAAGLGGGAPAGGDVLSQIPTG